MENTNLQSSDYKTISEQFLKIPIEGFFEEMSKCLAQLFSVDCVIISQASVTCADTLHAISIYCDDQFSPPFIYSIDGAPCKKMLNGKPFSTYGNLAEEYPSLSFLTDQDFKHYMGFPLRDCNKQAVGYIALFNRCRIDNAETVLSVLKVASKRTVRELLSSKSVAKIERLNQGLRLPSGKDFYQRLTEIMTNHIGVDVAFIAQLNAPNARSMRINALSGVNIIKQKSCDTLELANNVRVISSTQDAAEKLPQLIPLLSQEFKAGVVIKLNDQGGNNIGFIGGLAYRKLTCTDSVIEMLDGFCARIEMELENQISEYQLKYFNEILSATDDLLSFVDHNYHYRAVNQAYCKKFGKDAHELINQPIAALHGQMQFENTIRPGIALALKGQTNTVEVVHKNNEGEDIYIHGRHHPSFDANGQVAGVVVSARDVTELKQVQLALAVSEERLQMLYNQTPSMFFTINTHFVIQSVNTFGANKLGYQVDELIDKNLLTLYATDDREQMRERLTCCFEAPDKVYDWEVRQMQLDGRSLWVKQTAQVVNMLDQGYQLFLASEDISEKHRLSQKLSYQATHDSLTGLTNRLEFERALRRLIKRKDEYKQEVHILCYIDLDRFKLINDSCGHLAGDELLRNVADILSQNVRKSDVLARIGGDEFAILMENCALHKAKAIAEVIRMAIKDYTLVWKDKNYQIGASIGISVFDLQADSITQALSAADEACYSAKAGGRNQVFVYRSSTEEQREQRTELQFLASLKEAIKYSKFEMYAQPIFGAKERSEVKAYELLLRLRNNGKYVEANKVFQIAQQHQLITEIDEWVIAHGFSWLANAGHQVEMDYCAINISGSSAGNAEFLEYVLYQLSKHQLCGTNICFEITEAGTMSNLIGVSNFMIELRKHGCLFTLDNFGSGTSSFNHLKNLSFDQVKISEEYLHGLVINDVDKAMVEAIVGICRALGKTSIAVAVESESVYQYLLEIQVDCIQGFYCGKPMPLLTIS